MTIDYEANRAAWHIQSNSYNEDQVPVLHLLWGEGSTRTPERDALWCIRVPRTAFTRGIQEQPFSLTLLRRHGDTYPVALERNWRTLIGMRGAP